ncbi:SGNH/GDSL hydrolase family protein [Cohnella suwonensis]|uniref:SGNH/GDSL hydrolase family protein n=1 Tax=Cohnella suwonensis TaxID=696072 RepID=A0ABW0LW35_9BACL
MTRKSRLALVAGILTIGLLTGCGAGGDASTASPTASTTVTAISPAPASATAIATASTTGSAAGQTEDPMEKYYEQSIAVQGVPSRIAQAMKKAKDGQPVTLGVIGGSITVGYLSSDLQKRSWAALLRAWWENKFPDSKLTYVNAGIGATGSLLGVHRVDKDLLEATPDMVVVEFSVNDLGVASATETYEGLMRKILKSDGNPGVLTLDMMNNRGESWQEHFIPVNEYYGIPLISYRDAVWPKIQAGELSWADVSPDEVHPNDKGHELAADLIIRYLDDLYAQLDTIATPSYELTASVTDNGFENSTLDNNLNLTPSSTGGWEAYSYEGLWGDGWIASAKGKPLAFDVKAASITVNFARFNFEGKGAKAYVMIDGKTRVDFDADFSGGWGDYMESKTILKEREAKKHRLEFYYDDEVDKEFRIVSIMAAGY